MIEDISDFPETCETPPEGFSTLYEKFTNPNGSTSYRMTSETKEMFAGYAKQLADLEKEHAEKLEAQRKENDRIEAELFERTVDAEIDKCISASGVMPKFSRGVRALLRGELKFETQGDTLVVVNDAGACDLAHAVQTWLASEEGQHFTEPSKTTTTFDALRKITKG